MPLKPNKNENMKPEKKNTLGSTADGQDCGTSTANALCKVITKSSFTSLEGDHYIQW